MTKTQFDRKNHSSEHTYQPFLINKNERILVATSNFSKSFTISQVLIEHGLKPKSWKEALLQSPEESGLSFLENSKIKAVTAAQTSGNIAIGDDSGFCIAALGGMPGVSSSDWARFGDYTEAIAKIGFLLSSKKIYNSPCWISIAITMAWPSGLFVQEEYSMVGRLVWPPRGYGLDYDVIFSLSGGDKTVAEEGSYDDEKLGLRTSYRHRLYVMRSILKKIVII